MLSEYEPRIYYYKDLVIILLEPSGGVDELSNKDCQELLTLIDNNLNGENLLLMIGMFESNAPAIEASVSRLYDLLEKQSLNYLIVCSNELEHLCNDKIISIDLHMFIVLAHHEKNHLDIGWNPNSNNILYYPGKLFKPERAEAFSRFLLKHKLKNLIYNVDREYLDTCEHTADLKSLIVNIKPLDQVAYLEDMLLMFEEYTLSAIEYVTESWCWNEKFLTEKTFRPIIRGMPFIHLGINFNQRIKALGFKSYYDLIDLDDNGRSLNIKETVDRCYKFLEIKNDRNIQEEIRSRISHNRSNAFRIYDGFIKQINTRLGKHIIKKDEFSDLIVKSYR